jgi:hypothetical protein
MEIKDDFLENREVTLKQKLWAYRRGFFSFRIEMYGLNDENYAHYLSDFVYNKLQPVNGRFRIWIDDKLTMKYVLYPFNEYLPKYFYHLINDGREATIIRLMDCPDEYGQDVADVMNLLKAEGSLAVKLIAGTHGDGFYKITYSADKYYVNDKPFCKDEMLEFLQTLDGYIVTEYLFTHKNLSRIWDKTPNALRILTVKEEGREPQIADSYIRFGTKKSGPVEHNTAENVVAPVQLDSGLFTNGKMIINNKIQDCKIHPDTKAALEGKLPFWEQITETILAICSYIPQVRYMGFDIIITDNGFKIIEINSRPGIGFHNYSHPVLTNDKCKELFINLIDEQASNI